MEALVMTEDPKAQEEQQPEQPEEEFAKIVIYLMGDTPVPQYVDFQRITPFHMIAIGEWLSLKGRQMIAMAENAEKNPGIIVPKMDEDMIKRVVGVGTKP
jgi:hypothetical protein